MIHFGGPWQVELYGQHRLTIGRQSELMLAVGTPGGGPGSTAWISHEKLIPEDAFPTAEIGYVAARQGDPPFKELYELRERC